MYKIKSTELFRFLEKKYKLPRYQRKETWRYDRNFELAVSIFQNYPIGVLISESKGGINWLLDGRQRKTALEAIVYYPTKVYVWACKYLGVTPGKDSDSEVKSKFKRKMKIFFEKDEDEKKEEEETDPLKDVGESENDYEKPLTGLQVRNLEVLRNLILMVHKVPFTLKVVEGRKRPQKVKVWESLFDFRYDYIGIRGKNKGVFDVTKAEGHQKVVSNMQYWDDTNKRWIFPELRKFILDYLDFCGDENNKEKFVEYCRTAASNFKIEDIEYFKEMVEYHWDNIKESVDAIGATRSVFDDLEIGEIILTEASPFDSLTIFSRVNSNGVKLNAEELLSSKPFWNKEVGPSLYRGVEQNIEALYKNTLKVLQDDETLEDLQDDGTYRRWDIGATLIERLGDNFIFGEEKDKGHFMGFKLLSSFYCGGMSKVELAELESKEKGDLVWSGIRPRQDEDGDGKETAPVPGRLEVLIKELKELLQILSGCKFFERFARAKMPISRLLGNAPAFEFITVLWRSWKNPETTGDRKKDIDIQNEAVRLFDKLVYETVNGDWGHAGDSTMRGHIKKWDKRVESSTAYEAWEALITSAAKKRYELGNGKYANMAPILYYLEALKPSGFPRFYADGENDRIDQEPYDIDHILPQAAFGNSSGYNKDCLANLSLLHHSHNIRKGDKLLNSLTIDEDNDTLVEAVEMASGIKRAEFNEYSSMRTFEEFVTKRTDYLLNEVFKKYRPALTGNR